MATLTSADLIASCLTEGTIPQRHTAVAALCDEALHALLAASVITVAEEEDDEQAYLDADSLAARACTESARLSDTAEVTPLRIAVEQADTNCDLRVALRALASYHDRQSVAD